jgi:hypothetical protein
MAWVRAQTILTERQPLVSEVSASFCGYRVPHGQRNGSLRPYSRIFRPVMKDAARVKEHVNYIFHLIHVWVCLSGLESWEHRCRDSSRWPCGTSLSINVGTYFANKRRSLGIVLSQTQTTECSFFMSMSLSTVLNMLVLSTTLYYWYTFRSCVCDTRYDEWWGRRKNATYIKIVLCKELWNGLLRYVGKSVLSTLTLKSCVICPLLFMSLLIL